LIKKKIGSILIRAVTNEEFIEKYNFLFFFFIFSLKQDCIWFVGFWVSVRKN